MRARNAAFAIAAMLCAACAGSRLSGKYGGNSCPFELTFGKGNVVYFQYMGSPQTEATYRLDGDRLIITAANGGNVVFTRKGDALETSVMGEPLLCKKEAQ